MKINVRLDLTSHEAALSGSENYSPIDTLQTLGREDTVDGRRL